MDILGEGIISQLNMNPSSPNKSLRFSRYMDKWARKRDEMQGAGYKIY
jgi:hypothetical protein